MWASILTAVGEAFKFLNDNIFTAKRRAKSLEEEKQAAIEKARKLAYGDDEKALGEHIGKLPK